MTDAEEKLWPGERVCRACRKDAPAYTVHDKSAPGAPLIVAIPTCCAYFIACPGYTGVVPERRAPATSGD